MGRPQLVETLCAVDRLARVDADAVIAAPTWSASRSSERQRILEQLAQGAGQEDPRATACATPDARAPFEEAQSSRGKA